MAHETSAAPPKRSRRNIWFIASAPLITPTSQRFFRKGRASRKGIDLLVFGRRPMEIDRVHDNHCLFSDGSRGAHGSTGPNEPFCHSVYMGAAFLLRLPPPSTSRDWLSGAHRNSHRSLTRYRLAASAEWTPGVLESDTPVAARAQKRGIIADRSLAQILPWWVSLFEIKRDLMSGWSAASF
jgi:hypothetical protein